MEQVRKTKIICTMGPSTEKEGVLEKFDVGRYERCPF